MKVLKLHCWRQYHGKQQYYPPVAAIQAVSQSEKGKCCIRRAGRREAGAVIETGDKINSTYTNNTDANLFVTAVEDTLFNIALASEPPLS